MRSLFTSLFLLLAGLAALVHATSSAGSRLLVISDDVAADKETYSTFLGDVESRGFDITFEAPKSESLKLFTLGERSYDHILLLPTKGKGIGPNLTPQALLDFYNAEGNILLTLSSTNTAPTSLVSVLLELDIHLPSDRTGTVVDHFSYDTLSAADLHDVLVLPAPGPYREDVKDLFSPSEDTTLAFPRGVAQSLGSGALLTPILRAPRTAYSYNPKEQSEGIESGDELFGVGKQLSLISTMQARNSARFTVVGSAEMLSDAWIEAEVQKTGTKDKVTVANREFARRVSGWTFKEIGVLKVNWIEHHLNEIGGSNESNPKIYKVKNDVTYSISMSEYVWDSWTAFTVPDTDALQLEFSMLSPFHRLPLHPVLSTSDSTIFSVSFKLPDQHGIFNFKVNYKRPFLTNVEEKNTVSVRHMAHDEWPRSYVISGAWPWISGVGVTVVGFVSFCAVWMYSAPAQSVAKGKKTQ
ncbi:hypothetical protein MKZ38_002480 [Zalerion maritima]|uniref:Dolichyl-diphosphooligosaccharide--protein glycosyltransferase subunit WBP1 n=1 Tax=Zalerion maritima TaxID=339359 RepID=A0AAD5RNV1_9PEZI|nr:hypothetical protein MKZ38_002480 [Zalerion maritima]